jgi:hypothetical protein
MVFDLRGRRKVLVRIIYCGLALLMAAGLVLFGIGSSGSGGLLNAITNSPHANTSLSHVLQVRIASSERQVAAHPRDANGWAALVEDHYELAQINATATSNGSLSYNAAGQQQLTLAGQSWVKFTKLTTHPSAAQLQQAYDIFGPSGLNQGIQELPVAEKLSKIYPSDWEYFYAVAVYSAEQGQQRTSTLAAHKALALAPKSDRKQITSALKQLHSQLAQASSTTASTTATTPSLPIP